MVRFGIIGIVVGVAFTLYALVDSAMSDGSRARGVSKPIWVVLIVVLPVIGGILWFTVGKARGEAPKPTLAADDDPRFTGRSGSQREVDARLKDLEAQLHALDDEVYPGEETHNGSATAADDPANASSSKQAATEQAAVDHSAPDQSDQSEETETAAGEPTPDGGQLPTGPETGPSEPTRP